jgi:hypothetical protein
VRVNVPVAVPLTDTSLSRPVDADKVPALADADVDVVVDGVVGVAPAVDGEPVVDVEFVVDAEFVVAEPSSPGDLKASGAVVSSGVEADGAAPVPPRPGGPPRAWDRLAGAPCVEAPTAPADDGL